MQPIPKIIDQGYARQKIVYSQAYKDRKESFWNRLKKIFYSLFFLILRFLGLPHPYLIKPNLQSKNLNLVSSFDGNISKILFAFPYRYFESKKNRHDIKIQKEIKKIFSQVIKTIDVELDNMYIISEPKTKALITKWLVEEELITIQQQDDVKFLLTNINDFTVWIQDPIAVIKNVDTENYFIKTPPDFIRDNDSQIGLFTIEAGASIFDKKFLPTSNPVSTGKLYFEGGNMLVGDDFWLKGINDLAEYAHLVGKPFDTPADIDAIKQLYQQTFDSRELILIKGSFPDQVPKDLSTTFKIKNPKTHKERLWFQSFYTGNREYSGNYQPIFHIDMFISLAGRLPKTSPSKFTVVIGSPKMAFDILTNCYPGIGNSDLIQVIDNCLDNPKNDSQKRQAIEIINNQPTMELIINDIEIMLKTAGISKQTIDDIDNELNRYKVMQDNVNAAYSSYFKYTENALFDQIANDFDSDRFNVVRSPLPYIYEDNPDEDPDFSLRSWYFATSNNVLIQNQVHHKQVFIPTYGYGSWEILKWTDKKHYEIWSKLGYDEITLMPNFQVFAYNLGAMHCLVKTLERT